MIIPSWLYSIEFLCIKFWPMGGLTKWGKTDSCQETMDKSSMEVEVGKIYLAMGTIQVVDDVALKCSCTG